MAESKGKAFKSVIDRMKSERGIRILYLIQIIGLIAIIANPLGLPLQVDSYTRSMYQDLRALPDGSVVVVEFQTTVAFQPEVKPGSVAVLNLLFSKNLKLVFYSITTEGYVVLPWTLDAVQKSIISARKYGVDWVVFGFAPGVESAIASFAKNIRATFKVDTYGTPIDEIPMMKNINSAADVKAVLLVSGLPSESESAIRQWVGSYKMPLYTVTSGGTFAILQPYYPAQIRGMTNGVLGGAQMEILVGIKGEGARTSDGLTFIFLLGIAAVISGNAIYFYEKRKR
jgi:hypothetical protein